MVRLTTILERVPVIKFRKGGINQAAGATPSATSAPAAAAAPAASVQPSAPMSTTAVPDIDLPLRYRRRPLSQEEIDHINGGGIV